MKTPKKHALDTEFQEIETACAPISFGVSIMTPKFQDDSCKSFSRYPLNEQTNKQTEDDFKA